LASKLKGGPKIDLLFLDGLPSQYLDYLKAAESSLAPGALVVADNAGIFSQGGLKPYLEYVRSSPSYESRFIECPLEWRDDVADGLEVSTFKGLTS
jgi:predicted O-methyltransferase YrrM